MRKKQHTVWHWTSILSKGNFAQVGVVHNYKGSIKEDVSQFFESLLSEHDSLISQPAYQYDIKTSRGTDSSHSTQAHSAMFPSSEHRGSNEASHTNVSHDTAQADVSSGRG